MKNKDLLTFRISTALFTIMISFGVGMYFLKPEIMSEQFEQIGYPGYLIYPLGLAKLLGFVAIWIIKYKPLKEWAYAGFTFNLLLATAGHIIVDDGEFMSSAVPLILLAVSYFFYKKVQSQALKTKNSSHD